MKRVCIANADAPASQLRYHTISASRFQLHGGAFEGFVCGCGALVHCIYGINSIRVDRAEAMGAKPCARCFRDEVQP